MTTPAPVYKASPEALRDQRRAWWVLLLYPVSFVAAFLVGEGLASALGYEGGTSATPPWYVPLVAGVPALALFAAPGVAAVLYGRRAYRAGAPGAVAPMVVGIVVGGGFIAVNLLSLVAMLLFG
jgi:hypothetical protein